MVERCPDKTEVEGPIPSAPTIGTRKGIKIIFRSQKNEMISRRDEEVVSAGYADEEPRRNQPFFGFPSGGRIKAIFFVASELTMRKGIRLAPRASNLALIRFR